MQQATSNNHVYSVSVDDDEVLWISVNGQSFDTGQLSYGQPALAVNNGQLFLAWTGTGDQNLNVAKVAVDGPTGNYTGLVEHEVLGKHKRSRRGLCQL